ncbi:MAG TPA: biotin/lipoyl-containing protein [Ignavibacteriaceae bacterium]|jgi:biotin carboxyl carrier protein|nr:biotin/lipoyl-containing protein [Ignavibacteriaceae bacterium]
MKKFKFTIQGNSYDVEILNFEDNTAEIDVNGTIYKVDVEHEVKKVKTPKLVRNKVEPSAGGDIAKTSRPSERKGAGAIKAPLPGTIIEVRVKPGDKVKMSDKLLVMEAMKMENNINSDREGTIIDVKVKAGDAVLEGDLLVEIGE